MSAPLTIDLSDPRLYNEVYLPIITDRSRYVVMYGGRDSAKSYAAQKVVFHLLNEPYCKAVCLRKVFADIKDPQFETLWTVICSWGLDIYFKYTVCFGNVDR